MEIKPLDRLKESTDMVLRYAPELGGFAVGIPQKLLDAFNYAVGRPTYEGLRAEVSSLQAEQAKLLEENEYIKTHDVLLKGIYNRDGLTSQLEKHVERNKPEAIHAFFMDIVDFKKLNDKHGQTQGDKVLLLVGWAMKQYFTVSDEDSVDRTYPLLARFGGDEFVGILPDNSHPNDEIFNDSLTQETVVNGQQDNEVYKEILVFNLVNFLKSSERHDTFVPRNIYEAMRTTIGLGIEEVGLSVNGATIEKVAEPKHVTEQFYRTLEKFDMKSIRRTAQ